MGGGEDRRVGLTLLSKEKRKKRGKNVAASVLHISCKEEKSLKIFHFT